MAEPTKVFIACDTKKEFGAVRGVTPSKERDDGARCWEESSPTNGQEKKKCNQQRGRARREAAGQSRASLKVHARRQLHFALALRVVLTESEDEMRSTVSVSLPNWAYVDDITIATTAELAPSSRPSADGRFRGMALCSGVTNAQPIARQKQEHLKSEKK